MPVDLSIQTTSSTTDITNTLHKCRCFVVERKTKSEEKLKIDKEFSEEILELLKRVTICPSVDPRACDLRSQVLEQMSKKLQMLSESVGLDETRENKMDIVGKMLNYVPIWVPCGDVQSYRDAISDEIISKMNHNSYSQVYRAEAQVKIRTERNELEEVLYNLISSMPIKTMDIFGKPAEKNRIVETYIKRLKRLITNLSNVDLNILKSEILVVISKIPIAISVSNKMTYLNKIVDSLMDNLKHLKLDKNNHDNLTTGHNVSVQKNIKKVDERLKKYVQPTQEELQEYISEELFSFLGHSNFNVNNAKDVETELIDILIDSIQDIRMGKTDTLANEITLLLLQEVDGLSQKEAKNFTEKILNNVKAIFKKEESSISVTEQTYVVLQNSCCKQASQQVSSDLSIGAISKGDIDANLAVYMNKLTEQIEEWLDNLKVEIPQANETGFRQVVVDDLAGDIIDRHKYLELNPSCRGTDEDELEHLKYQIFKWINKLAGEDNKRTIESAPELMQRIQSIPIPMLTELQQSNRDRSNTCTTKSNRKISDSDQSNKRAKLRMENTPNQGLPSNTNNFNMANKPHVNKPDDVPASCCASAHLKPFSPSMKELNAEYDDFLKNWVQEIPFLSSNAKEKAVAEKSRMGIYNGVWKAITKLRFEPATLHNPFYYEDALDDELEELFSTLPKSPELETKKYSLKAQLIEKTINTNDLVKSASAPASFKQKLVESVRKSLPQSSLTDDEDEISKQPFQELQILKLVENFVLCTNYKEEDKEKANIYRKKLLNDLQTLIDNYKKTHTNDIDPDFFTIGVLNALQKVPLPSKNVIQDEANEILLSLEVDTWFTDLPLIESEDPDEQLQRKRLKDALVKKLYELGKEVNVHSCTGEKALKEEIFLFLEKVPLNDDENVNISFIADELANRIKNKAKESQISEARKSVAFMDSVGYLEFSKHIPHCSSFSKQPGARPAVRDQSSYMIRGGNIVRDSSSMGAPYDFRPQVNAPNYHTEQSMKPLPSDQYFTLEDSQASQQNNQPRMQIQPQMENVDWQSLPASYGPNKMLAQAEDVDWKSIPTPTISNIHNSSERQPSSCCQNATSPQRKQTISQEPRVSGGRTDQFNQGRSIPVNNVPQETPRPCSTRTRQGNLIAVSPTRQRPSTPMQMSMAYPNGMHTSQQPLRASDSYRDVERPQNDCCNRDRESFGNMSGVGGMNMQGLPSNTSYGEPQEFSTPQRVISQGSPPRPGRKRTRNTQKQRKDFARRRLELEDDTDNFESDDELCPCMERMFRCRRRPICYAYDNFEMDESQCYPVPFNCQYYY